MQDVVLASSNAGKLKELAHALAPLGWNLRPLSDFTNEQAEETGSTFVENALIKARHASAVSGLPALADDSGLAVDALDGQPGVWSARYAGENASDADNNQKLLRAMQGQTNRNAAFHCVLALVQSADDPQPLVVDGLWSGQILEAPRGTQGFGYDPLFLDPTIGRASAELSPDEKRARSHRGRAVTLLIEALQAR